MCLCSVHYLNQTPRDSRRRSERRERIREKRQVESSIDVTGRPCCRPISTYNSNDKMENVYAHARCCAIQSIYILFLSIIYLLECVALAHRTQYSIVHGIRRQEQRFGGRGGDDCDDCDDDNDGDVDVNYIITIIETIISTISIYLCPK